MDVAKHLSVIWRRKWQVLAISVVVAGVVFGVSVSRDDVYRAQGLVAFTPARESAASPPDEDTTLFLARNYAARAETRPVVEDLIRRSGLPLTLEEALDRVRVGLSGDAGFLTVEATGRTKNEAAQLAQATADALVAAVRADQKQAADRDVATISGEIASLEQQLANTNTSAPARRTLEARYESLVVSAAERRLQPVDRLDIVAPARADDAPASPKPKRDALLAFVVALVLNAEAFVLIEALSDRFSGKDLSEELLRLTGLPILARIPDGDEEAINEAFNTLRTNLLFMELAEQVRTVAVVSVEPGAGKSFASIHLARSMAGISILTVLVDGDIRRPVLHERLGLPGAPGLSNVLNGYDLAEAVREVPDEPMLKLLPAGAPAPDPAGLFALRPLRKFLRGIQAEMVVVDTPAEALFADAATIASQCDIAVLIVDVKATRRASVRATVDRLRQVNVNIVGAVMNRAEPVSKRSYYARYRESEPVRAVSS